MQLIFIWAYNKKDLSRFINYYPNISMDMIFMNTENSKTNELHKFFLNLSQILDLRSSNKHIVLQNLSIYYRWKIKDNTKKTIN